MTKPDDKKPDTNVFVQFLRNIGVGIRAPGPTAILICWMLCVTALGLFGSSAYASSALIFLMFFAGAAVAILVKKL